MDLRPDIDALKTALRDEANCATRRIERFYAAKIEELESRQAVLESMPVSSLDLLRDAEYCGLRIISIPNWGNRGEEHVTLVVGSNQFPLPEIPAPGLRAGGHRLIVAILAEPASEQEDGTTG